MRVFIIGGTGFLGYYTVRELLARGHSVSTIALEPLPPSDPMPPEVQVRIANFNKLSDDEVLAMLEGVEGIIYAAGVDDRVVPKRPAYPFFYRGNVLPAQRLARLARQAGVRHLVVFNSYFSTMARRWPELELEEKHPYIRSRVEQIAAVNAEAGDSLVASYLMLPYIFGYVPGKAPLWTPIISYLRSAFPLVFYPAGGSAMVSVQEVASAAVRALESGRPGAEYEISTENLTWVQWLERLMQILGRQKSILTLPKWLVKFGMSFVKLNFLLKGQEGGLNPIPFVELQTRNSFLDGEGTRAELGYPQGDLETALRETVEASLAWKKKA